MNKKNNQRIRLSKLLLKNALMDLLDEKGSIDKISVKELCNTAGLNRSTFYAHYNEPSDLLAELKNDLLKSEKEYLEKIGSENDLGANKYILSLLEFIKQNNNTIRTLLINSNNYDFQSKLMEEVINILISNIDISLAPEIENYVYSYILNGSNSIITNWIKSDYTLPKERICKLLFQINRNALTNIEYI